MQKPQNNLDIDHLPEILRFDEAGSPQLVETHKRILTTAEQKGTEQAAAVANTYEHLADEYLRRQHTVGRGQPPQLALDRTYPIAKGGMLIHIANIWHEAGVRKPAVRNRFLMALDRAITYARDQKWLSIVTVLENERRKQLGTY